MFRVAALLVVLLLLIPPNGLLSDNEEDYFALAAQAFSHVQMPNSAVFDASPHRALNEFLLGGLIAAVGFADAQIIVRSLAAIGFAFALSAVFRLFALSALDAIIAVIVFARLGQGLMGIEWLFGDYEGKVAAYVSVLAGMYLLQAKRTTMPGTLLFVLATYFHFLVGIFWFFATLVWRWIARATGREERLTRREIILTAALFLLATTPLLGALLWFRHAAPAMPSDLPSPDVIYSIIRAPHHTSPFLTPEIFVSQWLPGYLMAGAMLGICIFIAATSASSRLRSTAIWLALLLAYLFVALVLAFIDRKTGVLGKFYLFRPSSLLLLLWLALVLAYLNGLNLPHAVALKLLTLAMIAPPLLLGSVQWMVQESASRHALVAQRQPLFDFLARGSSSESVVLIDPKVESSFLDFERRAHRPSLVMWKFMPTNDPEIVEWYRRMEFRRALFETGCQGKSAYPVDFLITSVERAAALSGSCGPIVEATKDFALLRRER